VGLRPLHSTAPDTLASSSSRPAASTSQGSFAQPVAEHALALLLSLLRNIPKRIRASSWGSPSGLSLFSRYVTILGAGGITLALLALLAPFEVEVTVLRRRAEPLEEEVLPLFYRRDGPGKLDVRSFKELHAILPSTDILVLAAALTSETHGIIGSSELAILPKHAVLVNVARGEHVQTPALLSALQRGVISGAGLDVTDPEPLPEDHPLWSLQRDSDAAYEEELPPDQRGNLIITPHTADTPEMVKPLLVQRFAANVRALKAGEGRFEGVVDPEWAY
jgi:phosphoglycerate dehydrogenase-like enzyme